MAVISGHQMVMDDLKAYARMADSETVREALEAGAMIIVGSVRSTIDDNRTGTLAKSIDYKLIGDSLGMGDAVGVDIGWKRIKRPGSGKSGYADIYGPVLEYSEKRKLRHMLAGYEVAETYATDMMMHILLKKTKK